MKPTYSRPGVRSSRRSVLKGTAIGVTGLAAMGGIVGAGVFISQKDHAGTAHADAPMTANPAAMAANPTAMAANVDSIQTILNIAITAEQLGVTFYTQALAHREKLDLSDAGFFDIKAALVEEQIHELFLAAQGAKALTSTFSFPFGEDTFERLDTFIKVQQLLEVHFVAAYIAAAREFAMLGRPDLVQVAMQIGTVEAEHRAIGRAIGGLRPANNHAFSPLLLKKVSDAPGVLTQNGFLTPKRGNSFVFHPVSTDLNGVTDRKPTDLFL